MQKQTNPRCMTFPVKLIKNGWGERKRECIIDLNSLLATNPHSPEVIFKNSIVLGIKQQQRNTELCYSVITQLEIKPPKQNRTTEPLRIRSLRETAWVMYKKMELKSQLIPTASKIIHCTTFPGFQQLSQMCRQLAFSNIAHILHTEGLRLYPHIASQDLNCWARKSVFLWFLKAFLSVCRQYRLPQNGCHFGGLRQTTKWLPWVTRW